jgi:hypothetical protein
MRRETQTGVPLWQRGVSTVELWGEHGGTLKQWEQAASSASLVRRRELPDDVVKAELEQLLDDLGAAAAEAGQYGPAVAAARTRLEARGLLRQRHEVTFAANPLEMYADAFRDPDFRAWLFPQLVALGWTPPAEAIEAKGEPVE